MFHGIAPRPVRRPEYDVDDVFVDRWSPRAFSDEEIDPGELMILLEAARWAPSAYNNQHWRFVYARRHDEHWERLVGLLVEGNRVWAEKAAALVVIVSKTTFDHNGKPARTHSFDTGAAWENFALQGTVRGWIVHGMSGFDAVRARDVLNVPADHEVEIMAAVGRPGAPEDLPEKLRAAERRPNGRKPLAEIVLAGGFDLQRGDA